MKKVIGKEDDSIEYLNGVHLMGEPREVECPECGESQDSLEPDVDEYECDCGVTVTCGGVWAV